MGALTTEPRLSGEFTWRVGAADRRTHIDPERYFGIGPLPYLCRNGTSGYTTDHSATSAS